MKCDLGEIACAIDRLTQAVYTSGDPSPFALWSGIVLPAILGILTLLVATVSVLIALQSSRLARAARLDAIERDLRETRAVFAGYASDHVSFCAKAVLEFGSTNHDLGRGARRTALFVASMGVEESEIAGTVSDYIDVAFSDNEIAAAGVDLEEYVMIATMGCETVIRRYVLKGDYEPRIMTFHDGKGGFRVFRSYNGDELNEPRFSKRERPREARSLGAFLGDLWRVVRKDHTEGA